MRWTQQDHWTERGRAASVADSKAIGRPHRSVLSFGPATMTVHQAAARSISLRIGILTVQCARREMGFLCFNIELVFVYQSKLFDPEQFATSNFDRRLVSVCNLLFVY